MKTTTAQITELSSRRCWAVSKFGHFIRNEYVPCEYNAKEAHWYLVNEAGYSEEITIEEVIKLKATVLHTPAPWATIQHFDGSITITNGVHAGKNADAWDAEKVANFRLASTAPEMLEALEALLGAFGHLALTDPPNRWPELEAAQRAIAKAKGE